MTIHVAESRTVAVPLEAAYDRTLAVPLTDIFGHRHLAMPSIVRVDDQRGEWGEAVGQTRTIRTSDRGSLTETLTELARPHRFGYRIDQIRGPMRPLVPHPPGGWAFAEDGSGTRITWSWEITPSSTLTVPLVALIGRMWHGYARQALASLDAILTG